MINEQKLMQRVESESEHIGTTHRGTIVSGMSLNMLRQIISECKEGDANDK